MSVVDKQVFRIGDNLLFVIVGAATPLAIGLATNRLPRLKLGRSEALLTIAATRFYHPAVVASDFQPGGKPDLETIVEFLPRPRQWPGPATSPGELRSF